MSKNKTAFFKNSLLISIFVLFSKVIGFIKQSVIAWAFGATGMTDAYFAADGFTSVFGEIMKQSIAPAVLTNYVKSDSQETIDQSKKLIRECLIFFSLAGIALSVLSVVFAPYISNIIGVSYTDAQKNDLVFYLRVLAPTLIFTAISGVAQGYLDANNRFMPAKLCSYFFSGCIIVSVLLFKDSLGVRSLLYGFVAGYGLHTLYMLFLLIRGIGFSLSVSFKNGLFFNVLKSFVPILIGVSVVDLGHLVDKIVASSLLTGSLSVLYYGQVVSNDIVNAVIITSIGTVLLPSLSRSVSENDHHSEIKEKIQTILLTITIITGVITSLYFVEGIDLIRFFFERGNFGSNDSEMVNSVVFCYSFGFIFMAHREVLIKAHYAFQDTLTPMINSIIGVIVNVIGSITLSSVMGVAGIALATSISMVLVMIISWFTIKKHIKESLLDKRMIISFIKILIASIIAGLCGKGLFILFLDIPTIIRLISIGLFILLIFFVVLIVLKEKQTLIVVNKVRGKSKE